MVLKGDKIKDFRGQEWTYSYLSREPTRNKSGKVLVTDEFGRLREFYLSVFPELEKEYNESV